MSVGLLLTDFIKEYNRDLKGTDAYWQLRHKQRDDTLPPIRVISLEPQKLFTEDHWLGGRFVVLN